MTDFETKYRDLVAGVTALADEAERGPRPRDFNGTVVAALVSTEALRALLASSPAEREGACPKCGDVHVGDGKPQRNCCDWSAFPDGMCDCCLADAAPTPVSSGEAGDLGPRESAADGGGNFHEQCAPSQRADGKHSWKFDGDDPWIECHYCHEVRDALTGFVARPAPVATPSTEDGQP